VSLQSISWRNHACTLDLYIGNEKIRRTSAAATAAYKALEYCFDEMNLHRVMAFIYAFNRPSWRLFEMTGAVREVTLKEQVARDGKLHDIYCYGLLRDEFKTFQQRMLPRLGLHTHCVVQGKG
jgi:RimJ/RimL family protein N-acetyltransferase